MFEGLRRKAAAVIAAALVCCALPFGAMNAYAEEKPAKPVLSCQGAALYNATDGTFLYTKNADQQFFPASITKVMTALLVLENVPLTDIVTFSETATTNLEAGAVALDVAAGDQISVDDCLRGLLLRSANEVANGLAEHVSGSVPAFAELMNRKAASLGCTNTHFENPNGLNNAKHLFTAHDMALITAACFENPTFCEIEKTLTWHFPATKNRPEGTALSMSHKMTSPSSGRYYEGILGGKTGYTSKAGNTLVTCVELNGVRLVAVVLKANGTHYDDTKAMLDYGFQIAKAPASQLTGPGAGMTGESAAAPETEAAAGSQGTIEPAGPQETTAAETAAPEAVSSEASAETLGNAMVDPTSETETVTPTGAQAEIVTHEGVSVE